VILKKMKTNEKRYPAEKAILEPAGQGLQEDVS
jgi:hypothetical protein